MKTIKWIQKEPKSYKGIRLANKEIGKKPRGELRRIKHF